MQLMVAAPVAFAIAVALAGSPASGQVTQEGLVNVAIDDATVQVPVAIAANVCDVAVNLLTSGIQTGDVDCNAEGVSRAFR